jgi:hypothetical protein
VFAWDKLMRRFDVEMITFVFIGENTVNGDQSDAHISTLSQSSKEVSCRDWFGTVCC